MLINRQRRFRPYISVVEVELCRTYLTMQDLPNGAKDCHLCTKLCILSSFESVWYMVCIKKETSLALGFLQPLTVLFLVLVSFV